MVQVSMFWVSETSSPDQVHIRVSGRDRRITELWVSLSSDGPLLSPKDQP